MSVVVATRNQFVFLLHDLLSDTTHSNEHLRFTKDDCFEIIFESSLACKALNLEPSFNFKSLNSFIRQLSYYGFTRLSDRRKQRGNLKDQYVLFTHSSGFFRRGDSSRLNQIIRTSKILGDTRKSKYKAKVLKRQYQEERSSTDESEFLLVEEDISDEDIDPVQAQQLNSEVVPIPAPIIQQTKKVIPKRIPRQAVIEKIKAPKNRKFSTISTSNRSQESSIVTSPQSISTTSNIHSNNAPTWHSPLPFEVTSKAIFHSSKIYQEQSGSPDAKFTWASPARAPNKYITSSPNSITSSYSPISNEYSRSSLSSQGYSEDEVFRRKQLKYREPSSFDPKMYHRPETNRNRLGIKEYNPTSSQMDENPCNNTAPI